MALPPLDPKHDEPLKDRVIFSSALHPDDIEVMSSYNRIIKERTLEMTGTAINERLARIDAEFKRMEQAKLHLARLKSQTKAAILGTVSE